jgi:V8-like Glu-specific endopeptidase
LKNLLWAVIGLFTTSAFALPVAPFDALKVKIPKSIQLVQNQAAYDFEGIVKLSNCSGSLVAFNGMPLTAKAVVMTNGHCIQKPGGYLAPGEVWLNVRISRRMQIFDSQMKLYPIKSTKILYATMTDTDLAFYELDQSYAQIQAATGVRPLMLDANRPFIRDEIQIISGYWDRGWECSIDSFVFKMREAVWSWNDSIRYTNTCDTMGGTSGSPIIAKGTRLAVGVNNTSNEKGEMCTLNNPCEVTEDAVVTAHKGVRYGQQTYNVYSCLTPDFNFEMGLSHCELPR